MDAKATITVRKADERGKVDFGWLDSRHTFSFGKYNDPQHMGFRSLRVINEDFIEAGSGFPRHPHRDMEIVTYVIEGSLRHADSRGTSEIKAGDIQRMSAGTGIEHSEHNASDADRVHMLQIWILPEKTGAKPSYEQKNFPESAKRARLCLVGSKDGRDGSITIQRDVDLYACLLAAKLSVKLPLRPDRGVWVQLITGLIEVNARILGDGDGISLEGVKDVTIEAREDAHLLLFDLA